MLPERQSKAAIGALLIACALVTLLLPQTRARAEDAPPVCDEFGLALLSSPRAPWKGAPLRVIIATEKPLAGELALIAPTGKIAAHSSNMQGGPPYFWFAEIAAPEAGAWQVKLTREGAAPGCRDVTREIVVERNKPRGLVGARAFGRYASSGIARAKTCTRPGSRNCSTRRSTKTCRGRR